MKKTNLLIIVSFVLSACSFSNSNKEVITSMPTDELEFAVDTFGETEPTEVKVEEQKVLANNNEESMPELEEPQFKDFQKEVATEKEFIPEIEPIVAMDSSAPMLSKEEQYQVQKGDTLMMVAFKIYGDYRKWKDLKEWNRDVLKTKMGIGMTLKYIAPKESFSWQHVGLPYMVKTGDTLQTVSSDKYGTTKKWKAIYDNNRPLIRDPNLIFAGFTLYYVPTRDIASEHK